MGTRHLTGRRNDDRYCVGIGGLDKSNLSERPTQTYHPLDIAHQALKNSPANRAPTRSSLPSDGADTRLAPGRFSVDAVHTHSHGWLSS